MKLILLCSLVALAGCGGGGGGGSPATPASQPPPSSPPPPPPPASPLSHAGVWTGSMTYRGHPYSNVLCRVTANNTFPNQLTCFGFGGGRVDFALLGQYGTVDISPPNQWAATGTAYHGGSNGREPFALTSGEVTATELTLIFESGGATHQFKGVPAKQTLLGAASRGVYTSAWLGTTPTSLSVTGDSGDVFGQGGSCVINGGMNGLAMWGLFVELELSRCPGTPDGIYSGYGIVSESLLVPDPSATMVLVFAVKTSTDWAAGYALK